MAQVKKSLRESWVNYSQNKPAVFGLGVLIILFTISITAGLISPYDPFAIRLTEPGAKLAPPSQRFLLGTDHLGRDLLSRIIWGARVSLFIGFVAAGISATIGVLLGSTSGYYGGRLDNLCMRIVDIFLGIPSFFLILLVIALFGSSIWNVMIVIGLTTWPGQARLTRAEVLSVKEREYVLAARAAGAGDRHIIFREVLPNAIHPAIVNLSLLVGRAIIIEAGLSFLGLGDPMQLSWGWMLNEAMRYFRQAWWMVVFPGAMVCLAVLSFYVIGDGLNDALNPKMRKA